MIPIFWASPNMDGLTAACANAALAGVEGAGEKGELIQLNALGLRGCMACGNGWGTCRQEHSCCQKDGFEELRLKVLAAPAIALITPVYWGEEAEPMKTFLDRLRRCHATDKAMEGRSMLCVAAAGGSGNGTISCLEEMERLARQMGMRMFDGVMVTRFNRDYKIGQIKQAAGALAKS